MGVLAVEIKIPKGPAALKLLRARWELATYPPTPSPTSILWTADFQQRSENPHGEKRQHRWAKTIHQGSSVTCEVRGRNTLACVPPFVSEEDETQERFNNIVKVAQLAD